MKNIFREFLAQNTPPPSASLLRAGEKVAGGRMRCGTLADPLRRDEMSKFHPAFQGFSLSAFQLFSTAYISASVSAVFLTLSRNAAGPMTRA